MADPSLAIPAVEHWERRGCPALAGWDGFSDISCGSTSRTMGDKSKLTYDMNVDFPTPASPSSRIGTFGASLILFAIVVAACKPKLRDATLAVTLHDKVIDRRPAVTLCVARINKSKVVSRTMGRNERHRGRYKGSATRPPRRKSRAVACEGAARGGTIRCRCYVRQCQRSWRLDE